MSSEIEQTLKRIEKHPGVEGYIIVSKEGIPLRSSFSNEITQEYADPLKKLADLARSAVRDIQVTNNLVFLRVRTLQNEILVAPDEDFLLIVVQSHSSSSIM